MAADGSPRSVSDEVAVPMAASSVEGGEDPRIAKNLDDVRQFVHQSVDEFQQTLQKQGLVHFADVFASPSTHGEYVANDAVDAVLFALAEDKELDVLWKSVWNSLVDFEGFSMRAPYQVQAFYKAMDDSPSLNISTCISVLTQYLDGKLRTFSNVSYVDNILDNASDQHTRYSLLPLARFLKETVYLKKLLNILHEIRDTREAENLDDRPPTDSPMFHQWRVESNRWYLSAAELFQAWD